MKTQIQIIFLLSACLLIAQETKTLLDISNGRLPNDTAQDNQTQLSIEDSHPQLSGKVMKVDFAKGDTFGMARGGAVKNWKPFVAVEFKAFNPNSGNVGLNFVIKHRRSTSYQTRVDIPITLKSGPNHIRLGMDEMTNVNGSTPDFSDVQHWYLANQSGRVQTLYFTDILLVGGKPEVAKTPPSHSGSEVRITGTYRVKGTIGGQKVDLVITPQKTLKLPLKIQEIEPKHDQKKLDRIRNSSMPSLKKPIQFYTPEADAILSALEIFPPDNAFNQIIEDWPLHPNSKNIVASVGLDKPLRYNPDMGFVLVPPNQPKVPVKILAYPGESDPGPYPVPDNVPIEGWPVYYQRHKSTQPTLTEVQRRPPKYEGDRHAIVVDPANRMLYEFFTFGKTANGWAADQASIFDLKSNKLRQEGWTSSDAAGLPIFPAVVRYDELLRGEVEHAMRVTIRKTRRAYIHPATHYASRLEDENLPRMGERFRLRADFDISEFSPPVKAILKGLKKYGMLVADNGIEWAISVTPDPRIPNLHEELRKVRGSDFEVVVAPN